MKKIKRILAMIMAFVMIMGMSTMAFAEGETTSEPNVKKSATITISGVTAPNAEENIVGTTLQYLQVIEPDTTTATGWKFSSDSIEDDFLAAFEDEDETTPALDAQTVIAMMIKYQYHNATLPEGTPSVIANASEASATQISNALDNVINNEDNFETMNNPQTVTTAGVYAIKATESGYVYKAMAAYIGFDTVTIKGEGGAEDVVYEYPSLVDAVLGAKKISTEITKADNDDNDAVAINDTITYTVTTAFPYFNINEINKKFEVKDTITGAVYIGLVDDATTTEQNEQTASVMIGDANVTEDIEFVQSGNSFTVDLSEYINDANEYAGKTVTITYQAKITGTDIQNTASSHISDVEKDSDTVKLFTGTITLTKVDAENENIKLANAEFKVTKDGTELKFTKDATTGNYTYDPVNGEVTVVTDADGNIVVEGLDIGSYVFTETKAPTGYSVNENPLTITLGDEAAFVNNVATANYSDAGTITDTKLLALPSTGGIGTTIFTVAGCAIMIAAAGFFFASRKKEEE